MKRDQAAMRRAVSAAGACRICSTPYGLDAHHIVPRSLVQCDDPENLVVLCRDCHRRVHEKKIDLGMHLTRAEAAKSVLLLGTLHRAHRFLYPSEDEKRAFTTAVESSP